MSDEYAQATPEQKLNIATYFVMSAPVGEVDEVVAGQSDRETKKEAAGTRAHSGRHSRAAAAGGGREGGKESRDACGVLLPSPCRCTADFHCHSTHRCAALVSATALSFAVRLPPPPSSSLLLLLQM